MELNYADILLWASIILSIFYLGGLIRVMLYERAINKLHREREEEIREAQKQTSLKAIQERRIEHIIKGYIPKIEEKERRRRFLLDKLPFLRK